MKKNIIIIVSLLLSSFSLFASQKDTLWQTASEAYMKEDYTKALETYLQIEEQGYRSAELYYNIANSYYKQPSKLGNAILYYHKALKLDPSFDDARVNLELAQQQTEDKIEQVPEFVVITWVKSLRDTLPGNTWAVCSLVLVLIVLSCLLVYRYCAGTALQKVSFIVAFLCLLLALVSYLLSVSSARAFKSKSDGIVINAVLLVKSSPNNSSASLFELHEGTSVEAIENLGEWVKIEIADGRQGWIEHSAIGII